MACSVYNSCQQITKKLCQMRNELNSMLSEIDLIKQPSRCHQVCSKLSGSLQRSGGTLSDWYVRPIHHSSTAQPQSCDDTAKSTEVVLSSKNYIPGTMGCIISDIKRDMEKQKLVKSQERSEKRRTELIGDYSPKSVRKTHARCLNTYLEDYIDETDIENLDIYETDMDDQLMETIQTKLSDPNDPLVSPYHAQLAQLRMEEILLEEQRLLELKRIQELIRTRRPRKHWYMLRTSEFTEELMRNNEMVRNGKRNVDIDQYRTDLIKASLQSGEIFWKPLDSNLAQKEVVSSPLSNKYF